MTGKSDEMIMKFFCAASWKTLLGSVPSMSEGWKHEKDKIYVFPMEGGFSQLEQSSFEERGVIPCENQCNKRKPRGRLVDIPLFKMVVPTMALRSIGGE